MPEAHHTAAAESHHVAAFGDIEVIRHSLRHGPRGALVIASTALLALLAGWLAFYFLLFIPRGTIS